MNILLKCLGPVHILILINLPGSFFSLSPFLWPLLRFWYSDFSHSRRTIIFKTLPGSVLQSFSFFLATTQSVVFSSLPHNYLTNILCFFLFFSGQYSEFSILLPAAQLSSKICLGHFSGFFLFLWPILRVQYSTPCHTII